MEKVRYGLVGFGGIAESRIAKEGFGLDRARFAGNPAAELVGVTDIQPSRKPAAEALGLRWFDSLEALLAERPIEAVVVTTDNLSHYPAALAALRSGRHCLVEKPLATRRQDARELQETAAAKRLSLAVDHMMEFNAYNRQARDRVASGDIGAVNDICLHMEFLYGADPAEAATWRCADPAQLGGPIGDVGCHCLYMAEFLLGARITRLGCVYTPRHLGLRVEEGAEIRFLTERGTWGSARVCFDSARGGGEGTLLNLGFEVYGSRGVIRSYGTMFQLSGHEGEPVPIRLEVDRFHSREAVSIPSPPNIYQLAIARHAESIREGPPLGCEDGLHNLDLVLACHLSAHDSGRMQEIASPVAP